MYPFRHYWYFLTGSFWFIPGLIVLAAMLLALTTIEIDSRFVDNEVLRGWPRLFAAGAEASRHLLVAIATSMITVAATVFSITLVALSLASSQYSPRVLRNFIRDRSTQVVLGVFVGIFAYCLVVLRSIHNRPDIEFVPAVAVLLGLVLGFAGIATLVFFIHHIARAVQASHILAAVGRETGATIDRLFPHPLDAQLDKPPGDHDDETHAGTREEADDWVEVTADCSGYLQEIDFDRLQRLIGGHDSVIRAEGAIGSFVIEGGIIARYRPIAGEDHAELHPRIRSCWAIGDHRTLQQDVAFGIRQLVDVALKALSPSINDSTTATMCIDQLTALLVRMAHRRLRYEACIHAGVVRVIPRHPDFGDLLGRAFAQILEHANGNVAVLQRLLEATETLATRIHSPARRRGLLLHAERLLEAGRRTIAAPEARDGFDARARRLHAHLQAHP
jgi:uncharacterized membrane protein